MKEPLVSVIIPTCNSAATLPYCLSSIRRQTYKNIEVIVVDSYSTDNTAKIALYYGAKVFSVHAERTRAKNIGLLKAKGKYVLFVDADMMLTPKVVEECVKRAEEDYRIAGIIIPERSIGKGYWALVRDYERRFYLGTPIESARFFRRELALSVGGFDEDVIFYEEATLPRKLEMKGYITNVRIKYPILHLEYGFSLSRWLKKKHYYAKTLKIYKRKYGNAPASSVQLSPRMRMRIFLKREFLRYPQLAVGVLILKFLEFIVTLIGSHS